MSFNVENLFDNSHDEGHEDYEYLPFGDPFKNTGCSEVGNDYYREKCYATDWNQKILDQKIQSIVDVIYRDGKQTPDIVGLVEIENQKVINLLKEKLGYTKALITKGADQRGINVGLMFRESENLKFLGFEEIEVSNPSMNKPTRNILEVKFLINGKNTLYVFVNHWPSQNNPASDRVSVARSLLHRIDLLKDSTAGEKYFAIMGDLNVVKGDSPNAIEEVLLDSNSGLVDVESQFRTSKLISTELKNKIPPSSYYFKRGDNWNHLDRLIVSKNLLDQEMEEIDLQSFDIFAHPKYSRVKGKNRVPLRFEIKNGNGSGVSDHFPISVEIKL